MNEKIRLVNNEQGDRLNRESCRILRVFYVVYFFLFFFLTEAEVIPWNL